MISYFPSLHIHDLPDRLVIKRVPNLCPTQFCLDVSGLLFATSLAYFQWVKGVDFSEFPLPALFLGAGLFLLFFLRRTVNAWVGKVTLSKDGVTWWHTGLGGLTWKRRLPWDAIVKLQAVHENPHPRNQMTTAYFVELITKSGKTLTLLRMVTGYSEASNTCFKLNRLLANQGRFQG